MNNRKQFCILWCNFHFNLSVKIPEVKFKLARLLKSYSGSLSWTLLPFIHFVLWFSYIKRKWCLIFGIIFCLDGFYPHKNNLYTAMVPHSLFTQRHDLLFYSGIKLINCLFTWLDPHMNVLLSVEMAANLHYVL